MRTWIKKIFGFGLASFFSDFSHEMTISLIPILVTQFVGAAQAPFFLGIISSATGAFANFFALISGYLTDKLPRKKPLIALGYAMSALFSTLVGFSHSIWGLLSYRMLSFTGSGLREPPRDALIAATVEPAYYGRAFGLKSAMDTLGSLAGPLIALACAGIVSINGLFLLSFIPGLLSVCAIIFLTQDKAVATKKSFLAFDFWPTLKALPRPFIIFSTILFIFELGCFGKLMLLARAQEIVVAETYTIAQLLVLLYAFFNLTRACTEFTIGLVSDYINRIVLLALFGCGLFTLVSFLLLAPKSSLAYGMLLFALAGISTATLTTLKKACAADMLPSEIRGFGYGILQASEGCATLISNIVIGFLWSSYSAWLGFSFAVTLTLTATILLCIFGIMHRRA